MWKFKLDVPEQVVAGEPFVVRLSGEVKTGFSTNTIRSGLVIDGVSIDDGPFVGREETIQHGLALKNIINSRRTIDEPGNHRVRVRVWVVDCSSGTTGFRIDRNEDGSPIFPPGSAWLESKTIESTIEVISRSP